MAAAGEAEGTAATDDATRIAFLHEFSDSYVRTRHNNLRCFPSCGRVHRESSFCGRSVEIKVSKSIVDDPKSALLFGEFRRARGPTSYQLSEAFPLDRLRQEADRVELGEYVNMNDRYYRFVFTPNKKWRYDAKVPKQTELHVFTVYLVTNGTINSILNSKGFHVVPVWKTEDAALDKSDGDGATAPDSAAMESPRRTGASSISTKEDERQDTEPLANKKARPKRASGLPPTMAPAHPTLVQNSDKHVEHIVRKNLGMPHPPAPPSFHSYPPLQHLPRPSFAQGGSASQPSPQMMFPMFPYPPPSTIPVFAGPPPSQLPSQSVNGNAPVREAAFLQPNVMLPNANAGIYSNPMIPGLIPTSAILSEISKKDAFDSASDQARAASMANSAASLAYNPFLGNQPSGMFPMYLPMQPTTGPAGLSVPHSGPFFLPGTGYPPFTAMAPSGIDGMRQPVDGNTSSRTGAPPQVQKRRKI